jgi:anti-sigma factor RsiW
MKCHQVRELFFLYLDSELDPRSAEDVNLHLEACAECRKRWNREAALEKAVVHALWNQEASNQEASVEEFPWQDLERRLRAGASPGRPLRPRLMLGALVAGLVAFAGLGGWFFHRPGPPIDAAAREAVEHHEKYLAGKSPLQVEGSDRQALRTFYAGQLGFEVVVPDGRTPDGGLRRSFQLLGARRCTFLGGPVAYVSYRLGGEDATVIIGPIRPPKEISAALEGAPEGIARNRIGGCHVLISNVRGLLFFATSKAPAEELTKLLKAFQEQEP